MNKGPTQPVMLLAPPPPPSEMPIRRTAHHMVACLLGISNASYGSPVAQPATLVEVVDGDTIRVHTAQGKLDKVRLIGINTPEKGECWSVEATQALRRMLGTHPLTLVQDRTDRDQYGRLLRYVEVNGRSVNRDMVWSGHALSRRYGSDIAMADTLDQAQAHAKTAHLGVWDPSACGAVRGPGALIRITHIAFDAPGPDQDNLNGEYVDISNPGSTSADLTGWVLKDESASHRYRFPAGTHLGAGQTLRIHTGCGDDNAKALFWCKKGSAVWNNSGDTAFLLSDTGSLVSEKSY